MPIPIPALVHRSVIFAALTTCLASASFAQTNPGTLYKEFTRHCAGNKEWRVTDVKAAQKFEAARQFLPNPKLDLLIDDLQHAVRAEIMLDRWGGHVGTVNKRLRFNDNDWILIPELTNVPEGIRPEMLMFQDNPTVEVPLEHLVEGRNFFEASCDEEGGFGWGQWGLYSLVLRVYYDPVAKGKDFQIHGKILSPRNGQILVEHPEIEIEASAEMGVARVDVLAKHCNYDFDGDGEFAEYQESHFQLVRGSDNRIRNHVGTRWQTPYRIRWNTTWVPDQPPSSVSLLARVQDSRGYWAVTEEVSELTLQRNKWAVRLYPAEKVPIDFAVRMGETKTCEFEIPPQEIVLQQSARAALHLRTWHGWDGHHEPIKINEHEMAVSGKNHFYDYDLREFPIDILKPGTNTFSVHSKTEHHMLEVLWPGPAIVTRARTPGVTISSATYQDRPHFVITTRSATYWLDQKSGGLSRMIDREGNDWIAFRCKPWDEYPASSASSFRGLPNLVFNGPDKGFGHPGWDQAESVHIGDGEIVATSCSGKWQLRWNFLPTHAEVSVTCRDPGSRYWFLYEGPVAGRWSPDSQYFATDLTSPTARPRDYFQQDRLFGQWQWAYFGDVDTKRVLFIVHEQKDELDDTYSHLGDTTDGLTSGDGMVVFGFGRGPEGIQPLLTGKNSFRIGFLEQAGGSSIHYDEIKRKLESQPSRRVSQIP
jgi:hypothetical protein